MPVPARGLKVISIGMLKPRRDQVVAWRGPILDRALTQMLADVYWGDLDYLAHRSAARHWRRSNLARARSCPTLRYLVVTTPQSAAAEVAGARRHDGLDDESACDRRGGEHVATWLTTCPHCGQVHTYDIFGTGGGDGRRAHAQRAALATP